MSVSTQHKIAKINPPRVQITYDLEVGESKKTRELPFVIGVLSDLNLNPNGLKNRKFIEINKDNFNDIMKALDPSFKTTVKNYVGEPDKDLIIELNFDSLEALTPAAIVQKVPALYKLYQTRLKLKDLLAKLDTNEILRSLLQDVYKNKESRDTLIKELGNGQR